MTSNRQLLAVGVGMVVVAALIVGVVLWTQNDDDSDDDSAVDDGDEASTEFDEFADRDAGYQLLVPEDWVVTSLGDDVADVGEDLYPRNGRKADAVDRMAAALPRSVVMFGAEDDELAKGEFVTNMNLNVVPEARELTTEQVAEEF